MKGIRKMRCPSCRSENIRKNGHIHNGQQNHRCKECGRQFAGSPTEKIIFGRQRDLIKKLFMERIPLRGICRVMGVSLSWLILFFRQLTDDIPDDSATVKPEKSGLSAETDEMRSFVGKKKNRQRIWPAVDRASGQITGLHIGNRGKKDAEKLRKSLPGVCRQCAVCHTDFWKAYGQVIPECRHRPAGKGSGQTNRIGRTNCTLRQRISRPVRDTLPFSKISDHHIRAIKYFIWNFNI